MDMAKSLISETATSSRFLVKHVAKNNLDRNQQDISVQENALSSLDYTSQYMAFHSTWCHADSALEPTLILLCFDWTRYD